MHGQTNKRVLGCGVMLRLLIAGNSVFTDKDISSIEKLGYKVTTVQREDSPEIPNPEIYEVVICNWLFARHDIRAFKKLKAVQLTSAGLDRIPMDYAEQHKIQVRNARGIYNTPIAEFTVMAVLDAYKHSEYFYNNQRMCRWSKYRGLDELSDKTVCVFGTGSVGTEVARKFSVFADQLIGIDLYPEEKRFFTKVVGLEKMQSVLQKSDVVVLTLPLTDRTYHMFNEKIFEAMKDDAILVNVARGALIDESALQKVLSQGKFKEVILDVFENEPLDESYWGWETDRVRIIPHNTFESKNNAERMKKQIMDNLMDWAADLSGGG